MTLAWINMNKRLIFYYYEMHQKTLGPILAQVGLEYHRLRLVG